MDKPPQSRAQPYCNEPGARNTSTRPPGTVSAHHGFTHGWLVGELIQRVTDRLFAEVIQHELAEPLALDGLYVSAPATQFSRAPQLGELPLRRFGCLGRPQPPARRRSGTQQRHRDTFRRPAGPHRRRRTAVRAPDKEAALIRRRNAAILNRQLK